ncbi:MAG: poly-beta-1,6 N-acetyl-D-glucosamine export porin PgaA [Nevskia sp.]|nr:poly-beta-1,6 N-acetyl-D-glucosamine export porin PgaA [Nevskia sp.]
MAASVVSPKSVAHAGRPVPTVVIQPGWLNLFHSGNDAYALALFEETAAASQQPADVLLAAAAAYVRSGRRTEALRLDELGAKRFPDDERFAAAAIRTLADNGRGEAAAARADQVLRDARWSDRARAILLTAASYADRRAGNTMAALRDSERAMALQPQLDAVVGERVAAIEAVGAPHEALRLAEQHPDAVGEADLQRLRGSEAAQLVRFGTLEPASPAKRFDDIDSAIAELDNLIAQLKSGAPAPERAPAGPLLRARLDRIVALRWRVRMRQAVAEYETLLAARVAVPDYVLLPVADAYLRLRQPERAAKLYRQVLAREPDDFEASEGLFYALAESEHPADAIALIDDLNRRQPIWLWQKGDRVPVSNPRREATELQRAEARLFADDLAQAQSMFTWLTDQAPNNPNYRSGLAGLYAARGWPRRADEEYRIAATLDPYTPDPPRRANAAINDLGLQHYRQAATAIAALQEQFPEVAEVQRAQRELDLFERPEVTLSVQRSVTPATNVKLGAGLLASLESYTGPFDEHWRLYGGASSGHETDAGGSITLRRIEAGLEYRGGGYTARLAPSQNWWSGRSSTGVDAVLSAALDDEWEIDGKGSRFAGDTPLRALLNGVTADSGELGVHYRGSELFKASLDSGLTSYSDGNRAVGLKSNLQYQWYTRPHWQLSGLLDLAATHNSRPGQAYYSPDHDFEALPGIALRQILDHRYERLIENRLSLQGGVYDEKGYGAHPAGSATDKFSYHANNALRGDLELGYSRIAYDGLYENDFSVLLSVEWRY